MGKFLYSFRSDLKLLDFQSLSTFVMEIVGLVAGG